MTEHQGREEPRLTRVGRGAQGLGTPARSVPSERGGLPVARDTVLAEAAGLQRKRCHLGTAWHVFSRGG